MNDLEQAARQWQQYWDRLSDRPRFSYFGLDIERSNDGPRVDSPDTAGITA